tara:strand:+ start:37 stop:693 length:657 start_codon:yes stop_codon:yes gene_type:complete
MTKESYKKKESPNNTYKWGTGEDADSIRTMNSEELTDSVMQILEGINLEKGVWVFGYGSLMWNPDFKLAEKITGIVKGYRRSLCLKSMVYRGTRDFYGLVFGLDKGVSCQGMAYRIAEKDIHSEMLKIWEREMFAGTYIPTWVNVNTKKGDISAVTFVINHEHKHYLPNLGLEVIAERVARAEGNCGSCHDYVKNTVKCLHLHGLRDHALEDLLRLIE